METENNVTLTDDELSLIQTSLQINLLAFEKHVSNGGNLDFQNEKVYNDMKYLWNKLENEYF